MVLYGWGYDTIDAPNVDKLRTMGNVAADAIRQIGGSTYKVGGAAKLLGEAAG